MIYSDSENKSWWDKLSKFEKTELFEKMKEKARDPSFAQSLEKQWVEGRALSPKQIAALRRWEN